MLGYEGRRTERGSRLWTCCRCGVKYRGRQLFSLVEMFYKST